MAITRLALATPTANVNTLLYTSSRNALVSIIATNKSSTAAASIRIWVKPAGATTESEYSFITYDAPVPLLNTLETFRVPIMNNDEIYIRASTSDVSFSLTPITDGEESGKIEVGGKTIYYTMYNI
jgi:hypothetical protein